MRLFFFAALFLISSSLYSQDCKLNSFKDRRDAKKIVRLINNKDFSQANLLLRNASEHPVFNSLKLDFFTGNDV